MYIYATYDSSSKAVTEYVIVPEKKTAYANPTNGYRVNIPIDENVPVAFYEEFDNYKVIVNSSDSSIASLSIINSGKAGIKRKLGWNLSEIPSEGYNNSPYKNLDEEIASDVPAGLTAENRVAAIVALPWATERNNKASILQSL